MSAQTDLLNRWRQGFAAPGAPAAAGGVPADLQTDLENEVRPLLASLDAIEAEAEELNRRALIEAGGIIAAAEREAQRIVTEARSAAPGVRDAAAAARRAEDEATLSRLAFEADQQVNAIRAAGTARLPGLVRAVVECVTGAADARSAGHAA